MKTKTTMKEIKNNYSSLWFAGYADLQNIFRNREANCYNSGVYGWNCDIYIDFARDMAISTGYRNMAGSRIPDEILKKYDARALQIAKNTENLDWQEVDRRLEENAENFIEELSRLS